MAGSSPGDGVALLTGDAHAFAAFYRRYEDAVLGYFLRRTGSAELAADLAAETFARALAGRQRFDPELGDAAAWLFGIAANLLADSVRRGRVEDSMRRKLGFEPMALVDEDLARIDELGGQAASDALLELPAEQREAVIGRVLNERTYADLADGLACSQSVVRQRVSRGLRTLRTRLESNQ